MDEVRTRRDGVSGQSQDSSAGEGSKGKMEVEKGCSGTADNEPEKVQSSVDPVAGLEEACKKVSLGSELADNEKGNEAESVQHSMAAWQMEGKQLVEEAEAARSRARRIRVSSDCGGSYSNQIEPAGVRVGLQLGEQGARNAGVGLMPGEAKVASRNYRGRLKLAML